jgi:hypothetical protein
MDNRILDFYYTITDRLGGIYSSIRHFFRWIRQCITWSIFLWNDTDWDYDSILRILHYKIQRVRESIDENNLIVGCEKVVRQMRIAEYYLERLMANEYCEHEYKLLEEKYGQLKLETQVITSANSIKVHRLIGFHGPKSLTETDHKLEDWSHRFYHEKEDRMWQEEWDCVLKILQKHITKWWD